MPRLPLLGLGDALLRVLELNARYCTILGRVAGEFLRDLAGTLEEPFSAQEGTRRSISNDARHPSAPAQPRPPASAPGNPVSREPITLLEAEAGCWAVGAFTVGNHLEHEIVARPQASAFSHPPGTAGSPRLVFEPEVVSLAPREQVLVRMMAAVDDSLQPEVRYRCEVIVPALPGSHIPVVIRRRPDRPKPVAVPETPAPSPVPVEIQPSAKPKSVHQPNRTASRSRRAR